MIELQPSFVAATLLLFVAHIVRSARWALLFPPAYITRRIHLLFGLTLGYLTNAAVPWRLGELVRAGFVSERERVPFSLVAATVIAERLCDIIVVAGISLVLTLVLSVPTWRFPAATLGIAAAVIGASVAIRRSRRTRQAIWAIASIFNNRIRFGVVDFAWTLGELVIGGMLLRPRFLMTSLVMWLVYGLSYGLFAEATGTPLFEILFLMLGTPLTPAMAQWQASGAIGMAILAYMGLPLVAVLVYGGFKQWSTLVRSWIYGRRYGLLVGQPRNAGARDRFKSAEEYEVFLSSLFRGADSLVTDFGLRAVEDGVVHRFFNGGSDAVTALVEVDETLVIRKFAAGAAKDKLKVQLDWIERYQGEDFPLVATLASRATDKFFRYDMPLVAPSSDFYEVIHTAPIARSEAILSDVLDCVDGFHRRCALAPASDATVGDYVARKAVANARTILDFVSPTLSEQYRINEDVHDLRAWDVLCDPQWLASRLTTRATTVVHGDLTIENIIVAPLQGCGWYIIDPNPENIFDSPLIDWAKMMQSLHLGYETLNRSALGTIEDNVIKVVLNRSQAYAILHRHLEKLIVDRLGENALREVYLHELINYLRLTPYKIRQNPRKGLVFFACTSILLNNYLERFE